MKDWLGNEYGVGDKIIYAASHGNHGRSMVIAEVLKFNPTTITVRPLHDSRRGRRIFNGHVDTRTGKPVDPYSNKSWNSEDVWIMLPERVLQPLIKRVDFPAKPVALKVTKNITKWTGNG
jgi:hypothetical protein